MCVLKEKERLQKDCTPLYSTCITIQCIHMSKPLHKPLCVCKCVSIVTKHMSFVRTMLVVHVSQVFVCLFCSDLPPRLFPRNPRVSSCYQVIFVKGPSICACPLRTLCADISIFLFSTVNHGTHNPITVGLQKQATGTQKLRGRERETER